MDAVSQVWVWLASCLTQPLVTFVETFATCHTVSALISVPFHDLTNHSLDGAKRLKKVDLQSQLWKC